MRGLETAIADNWHAHRKRRFAMKLQQKIDRSLESHIRQHHTDWGECEDKNGRDKANTKVTALIKAARKGESDTTIIKTVLVADSAISPADEMRLAEEKEMKKIAKYLPAYDWVKSTPGLGALGFATIVAEATGTGDERLPVDNTLSLSGYATIENLWSRLGFAPHDGHAMSTWKRETWRPRSLEKQEWIDHPFKSERYAMMYSIADSLLRKQLIGKGKTESGESEPNGPYGEVYCKRRARTLITHPDWTPQHARMDAVRVAMKELLHDLWRAWRRAMNSVPTRGAM